MAERDVKIRLSVTDQASGALSKFDQKLNNISQRMGKFGQGMIDVGKGLSKYVTAPLVGIATAAIKTVVGFDNSMAKVQAISGATGDEFNQLRELAIDLGSSTAHSASAAADAMGYLALAGWDTNQIMEATPPLLALASAGAVDLASAADIVSNTLSAFGLEAEDAGRAADVFAAAQAGSNMDVLQMGETMKYAAPVARAFGVTLEETAAIAGVMADAGIQASMSGTAMRTGFTALANPTGAAADALAELNVETTNADGSMRNVIDILRDMEVGLDDMSDSAQMATMQAIFGKQAMPGWLALFDAGVDSVADFTDELEDSAGMAQHMADIMEDTIGGALKKMTSAIEGLLITLGDELKPYVVAAAEYLGDLAGKFRELEPDARRTAVIMGAFAAAIGPVLIVVGTLIKFVASLAPAFIAVKAVVLAIKAPFVIVAAAIAGVAYALYDAWKNSADFRDAVERLGTAVSDAFGTIKDKIVDALGRASKEVSDFSGHSLDALQRASQEADEFGGTLDALHEPLTRITETFAHLMEVVDGLWDRYGDTWADWLVAEFQSGIERANALIEVLNGVITVVEGLFDKDWSQLWDGLKRAGEGIVDWYSNTFPSKLGEAAGMAVGEMIGAYALKMEELIDKAKTWGRGIVENLIMGMIDIMPDWMKTAWDGILGMEGTFNAGDPLMEGAGISSGGSFREGLDSQSEHIIGAAEVIKDGTVSELEETIDPAGIAGNKTGEIFGTRVGDGRGTAVAAALQTVSAVMSEFRKGESQAGTAGSAIGNALANGIQVSLRGRIGDIVSETKSMIDQVVAAARAAAEIKNPSMATMRIGNALGEGLAIGIQQTTPMASAAGADMSGTAMLAMAHGQQRPPTSGSVVTSRSSSFAPVINVTVNSGSDGGGNAAREIERSFRNRIIPEMDAYFRRELAQRA